jgi:uncharacterized protein
MTSNKVKKCFIKSGNDQIYIEIGYPEKKSTNAVIVAHGLRSYYTGFLNIFAKELRKAGYISIKFHFVGTGKSSGNFEEKTTKAMLQNFSDVVKFVENMPEVKNIGIVGRSNAGNLATLLGPRKNIKAYVFLAAAAFYSKAVSDVVKHAKIKNNFYYDRSFARKHTKGEGRLPISYIDELKKYDKKVLENIPKMKPVIFFQSTKDEAVSVSMGHYDYWKRMLPEPRKLVLIEGGNHSYKGHKKFVIAESIKWFKKYLPVK